jgi:glycosyltransferase involved in cell wall biosynthesis
VSASPRPATRTTVLFVVHSLIGGGAERVLVQLVNQLDRRRFTPVLALGAAEGPYIADLRDDVEVRVLGGQRARSALVALTKLVWSLRPDVVMSTAGLNLAVASTRALYPRPTRVLLREANTPTAFLADIRRDSFRRARLYRASYKLLYRRADTVICQSEFMLRDLARLGVPASRLVRVYNPVDAEWVRRLASEGPPPERAAGPQLVTVGRLTYQKGYDVLLEALAQVRNQYPDVSLRIIGDGDERDGLEEASRSLGLANSIQFMGFRNNPYPFVSTADLFVSSSRYEGFSNAIVEAMACGTPVVATDCPSANREVIEEGVSGWLAPPEDPEALAQTICRALDERHGLNAKEIRDRCDARFSVRRIVAEYETLFSGNR